MITLLATCLVKYSVKGPDEALPTVFCLNGENCQGKFPKVEQAVPVLVKELEGVLRELVQL